MPDDMTPPAGWSHADCRSLLAKHHSGGRGASPVALVGRHCRALTAAVDRHRTSSVVVGRRWSPLVADRRAIGRRSSSDVAIGRRSTRHRPAVVVGRRRWSSIVGRGSSAAVGRRPPPSAANVRPSPSVMVVVRRRHRRSPSPPLPSVADVASHGSETGGGQFSIGPSRVSPRTGLEFRARA